MANKNQQTTRRGRGGSPDIGARVAEVAYVLFERRGFQHGRDVEDWVEAERIVLGELQESRRGGRAVKS